MKKEELRQSITELDADLVEEFCLTDAALQSRESAARTRAKMRGRLPKILISAACFLLILGLAIPLSLKIADRQESGSGIWKLESNQGYLLCISCQLSYGNHTRLRLNADYSNMITYGSNGSVTLSSEVSEEIANDPGVQLYGQWLYSQLALDYRLHFSLYQRSVVDKKFTVQAERCGYSYESALDRIDEVSAQVFRFMEFDCSYSLTSMIDITESARDGREDPDFGFVFKSMEQDGIDCSKVSEVRKYRFDDIRIVVNEIFTVDDFDLFDLLVYRYDGNWYIFGRIEDDLSIDMLGKNVDKLIGESETEAVVEQIGDHYILLEDDVALLCAQRPEGIEVGDAVQVRYTKSAGLRMNLLDRPGDRQVRSLISIEKIDSYDRSYEGG